MRLLRRRAPRVKLFCSLVIYICCVDLLIYSLFAYLTVYLFMISPNVSCLSNASVISTIFEVSPMRMMPAMRLLKK